MTTDVWTSEKIRETFLGYFESQGHSRMASSSLIPVGDPTLLFTSAGMVQFKSYFTGEAEPPNKRLTTSQKCFRTPDIEEVGDATHNTLFEMLGNFSIGDYFKQNAVDFAIELMTEGYGFPLEKFAAAVHDTDDETRELWVNKGIPRERVYSYGDDENWWGPAGDEGPCGPCSELHYDYGEERGCLEDDCIPNCKNVMDNGDVCDRYVELWNLVFMQFYHHLDGSRTNLPAPSVDTGMGFERLLRILQNVDTCYETDLFLPNRRRGRAHQRQELRRGPGVHVRHQGRRRARTQRDLPDRRRRGAGQRGPGLRAAPRHPPRHPVRSAHRHRGQLPRRDRRRDHREDGRDLPGARQQPRLHPDRAQAGGGPLPAGVRKRLLNTLRGARYA